MAQLAAFASIAATAPLRQQPASRRPTAATLLVSKGAVGTLSRTEGVARACWARRMVQIEVEQVMRLLGRVHLLRHQAAQAVLRGLPWRTIRGLLWMPGMWQERDLECLSWGKATGEIPATGLATGGQG